MDGNGRWANKRGLPRIEGHRRGAEAVKRTLEAAKKFNISHITLYAFSVENWNRPQDEVNGLMNLLERFLKSQSPHLIKHKIRLNVIGRIEGLPKATREMVSKVLAETAQFSETTLTLALNYGARSEIVDTVKSLIKAAQNGTLDPDTLSYEQIVQHLYTADLPDPDLVIRTSGELRLSNFLLLQSAYAEIYFCDTLWPDFEEADFLAALEEYAKRERRYGKTGEQLQAP